jgi:hypothetical protein
MPIPLEAAEVLNREFLEVRARILQIAAALDRIERAEGTVEGDPRLARIDEALAVLAGGRQGRAEQIQMIFSLPYQDGWRASLEIDKSR